MKYILILSLFFLKLSACAQKNAFAKTDMNTFFVCIDSVTYNNLFQNKYIKDSLFFCREMQNETTTYSYIGKYFIGQSATLEFFKPKVSDHFGDSFADCGIEFKTRKINTINEMVDKSKLLGFPVDTSTTSAILDSLPIPWYKSLQFKNTNNEFSILEYQTEYLQGLGFTKKQIEQPMTYKEFNNFLSNGKKYPRLFSMITYIKLYVDNKMFENLQHFAFLNNCKRVNNSFTNGETTIEFTKVKTLPKFSIQEIGVSLLSNQPLRTIIISNNLYLKIKGKKASLFFSNYN